MKRHSRGKVGLVAVCIMATHVFSLFSAEGKKLDTAVAQQKPLVKVPWITERIMMVPEDIWKEHYEGPKEIKCIASATEQTYHPKSFHAWVTAPKLENYQYTVNALEGVNLCDDQGIPPFHYLVVHEHAAVHYLKTVIHRGADILKRSKGGIDAYRFALDIVGQSPENEAVGYFFENQCCGNKEVVQYVFTEILLKKLLLVIEQRRDAEEVAATLQKADLILLHELRKSLGLPSFWREG